MLARGVPRFPTIGKMYGLDCVRSIAAHQTGRRDRLPFCVWKLVQDAIDDAAQDALRKTFSRRIDRRDAPKMDRYLLVVLDHLKLRMIHANSFSTQTRFTENNDALTRSDHFLHVMQVEPAAYERSTQRIRLRFLEGRFKDFLPAAKPAQRRFDHLPHTTGRRAGFFQR